ncbi:MAG: helix-turn-helix domain-containing protein [Oscillospiraceae bacterium]|nr:helix-turn-helix domain-containing protein [Oscillospiraceae bacterium]
MDKGYYTPKEVGKILKTSDQMVRVSLRQNAPGWDFPYIAMGRCIRIPVKTFDEWYKERYGT